MSALVILQPGEKLPGLAGVAGDFADWALAGMGRPRQGVLVVRPHRGEPLPEAAAGVVVTGSAAMVTDPDPWIAACARWLAAVVARGVPVLGICFGHQLLAVALGGVVDDNPRGIEVGTVTTRLTPEARRDPLFAPWPPTLAVQVSHRQSVLALPTGAVPLAASRRDPHHAFRYGESAWGVQFHPEFDARIVRAYLDYYRPDLAARGEDPEALATGIHEAPLASGLLARFGALLPA